MNVNEQIIYFIYVYMYTFNIFSILDLWLGPQVWKYMDPDLNAFEPSVVNLNRLKRLMGPK